MSEEPTVMLMNRGREKRFHVAHEANFTSAAGAPREVRFVVTAEEDPLDCIKLTFPPANIANVLGVDLSNDPEANQGPTVENPKSHLNLSMLKDAVRAIPDQNVTDCIQRIEDACCDEVDYLEIREDKISHGHIGVTYINFRGEEVVHGNAQLDEIPF